MGGLTVKWHERTFWNNGNVVHLNWGGGYREVHILSNCMLRVPLKGKMDSSPYAGTHGQSPDVSPHFCL